MSLSPSSSRFLWRFPSEHLKDIDLVDDSKNVSLYSNGLRSHINITFSPLQRGCLQLSSQPLIQTPERLGPLGELRGNGLARRLRLLGRRLPSRSEGKQRERGKSCGTRKRRLSLTCSEATSASAPKATNFSCNGTACLALRLGFWNFWFHIVGQITN